LEDLSVKLCEAFDVEHLRTKFYHAYPYQSENPTDEEKEQYRRQQGFFDAIGRKRNHQFVERGRVKQQHADYPECNEHFTEPKQKGVDVGIAVDLVEMANQNQGQAFIIVSGDEDLKHAVEIAKEKLCNVYLAFTADSRDGLYVSRKLANEVDHGVNMTPDFLSDCVMDS
jgi:uncharacterized LabA/DUF88 family protein